VARRVSPPPTTIDQLNRGMRTIVMPGARRAMAVVNTLIRANDVARASRARLSR
jgi:hypothetical protein